MNLRLNKQEVVKHQVVRHQVMNRIKIQINLKNERLLYKVIRKIINMNKHCFVLPSNLTVSFVNKPSINLLVGAYESDVIKLLINKCLPLLFNKT